MMVVREKGGFCPNLVRLRLDYIPPSGYISPAAMIDCLSSLPKLEELKIAFQSPQPRPDQETRRPPPSTRLFSLYSANFY